MKDNTNIWKEIEDAEQRYRELHLNDSVDYNRFYIYSIIAHSTSIEGSTLSETDVQLLFDEGITKKGNIIEHLMNLDLKKAYEYAVTEARRKTHITPALLNSLNALIMHNTGCLYNTAIGTFDSGRGDYRLCGVTAGVGGKSYMDYKKVPDRVNNLCEEINKRLDMDNVKDIYNLSFDAHFNLVTIHPWMDGNGRTSRLLMNYIQFYHGIIPTRIHKEDKGEYIKALEANREKESNLPFREFMTKQHLKTLREEIGNYKKSQSKSNGFRLLF